MSANKHTNPAYISHVHLKGYKSIIDTEVELHPGLNIIIGPNGSGKTNFLEFLLNILKLKLENLSFSYQFIIDYFFNETKFKYKGDYGKYYLDSTNTNIGKIKEEFFIDGSSEGGEKESYASLPAIQFEKGWRTLNPISIEFGIPKKVNALSNYLNLSFYKVNDSKNGFIEKSKKTIFEGLKNLILEAYEPILIDWLENTKEIRLHSIEFPSQLLSNLKKFSLIQDVIFDENSTFLKAKNELTLNNIQLKFLVNGKWLTWNQLSDGTKRLFYIITEVTLNEGMCLIEEPELGMYPEQLDLIMMFLQQQAKHKQIIITTHAPRILDFLGDDELNRIILTRYIQEIGTKMRHLSEEDIQLIIEYREKKGYTSDLWTMTSFFEDEEEIV